MAGSTVKIHRSRALSFKKLSFLYLVFIVFYFFSTSGEYIKQYQSMNKTQVMLNGILQAELEKIDCKNLEDIALKNKTIDLYNQLENIHKDLQDYIGNSITQDEKLKETKFSKQFVENGNYDNLKSAILNYAEMFPAEQKQSMISAFGITAENKNKLFTNIPNGFMGNVFKNYQTIVLKNAIRFLNEKTPKNEVAPKNPKVDLANKTQPFLQSLKSIYYLGEQVQFSLFSNNGSQPKLQINEVQIAVKAMNENTYTAIWKPTKPGFYTVVAANDLNTQSQQIEVKSLDLKFLENTQELVCFMNEPFTLTPYLSKNINIRELKFVSKEAKIEIEENHLKITPIVEGRFSLAVKLGDKLIENLSLFSKINTAPTVLIKDKYNQLTKTANAHALTSDHSVWQVVAFNMVCIEPDGKKQTFHSNNRFLNTEMLECQKNMPEGASIIFEQIKLLYNDGIKTTSGRPVYIQK